MKELLQDIVNQSSGFVELRYHENISNSMMAQKGRVDQASSSTQAGVGIRVLENGTWGFSSTSSLDRSSIDKAIDFARDAAVELSQNRKEKTSALPELELSKTDYVDPDFDSLEGMTISDKMDHVIETEKELANKSQQIHTAAIRYSEIFETKVIVTSDGALASKKIVRPEYRVVAYAGEGSDQQVASRSVGVTGGWNCLYQHPSCQNIIDDTAKEAVDLLKAGYIDGGQKTVILAPSLVGLLCHEAVGHTVEADFVQAGSVAKDKIGTRVASDLVNLCDSGQPHFRGGPGGFLPFDDEGVVCSTTEIIEKGILKNYLHNRESAQRYNVLPRGNARAWSYADEPLIRMTNTYLLPGTTSLDEMIASTDDGLLVLGAGGGQADATGEFMFGANCAYEIKNGKKGKMFREISLSGIAFDVLKSVDAVSKEFLWDLGSGYCGKGQPAKVDAGGPYIRCQLMLGGRQV